MIREVWNGDRRTNSSLVDQDDDSFSESTDSQDESFDKDTQKMKDKFNREVKNDHFERINDQKEEEDLTCLPGSLEISFPEVWIHVGKDIKPCPSTLFAESSKYSILYLQEGCDE